MRSGWDTWATVYRPLEYLALARALERARALTLAPPSPGDLPPAGARWLLLGDGDGRGLELLLAHRPEDVFVSLDLSGEMLRHSRRRAGGAGCASRGSDCVHARGAGRRARGVRSGEDDRSAETLRPDTNWPDTLRPDTPRVEWCQADIRDGWPEALAGRTFDAVVSQFFMDCFTDEEIGAWWPEVAAQLRPGGSWWVTDFTPPVALEGWPALRQRLILALLYPAFRWTTPMRARTLPDLQRPFREAGWAEVERALLPSGIGQAVRWRKPSAQSGMPNPSPKEMETPGGAPGGMGDAN